MKSVTWKAVTALASVGAAITARKAATSLWRKRTGEDPPLNPADPQTGWGQALAWTAATGLLAGVARMVARRGAAELWAAVDGELPAELQA